MEPDSLPKVRPVEAGDSVALSELFGELGFPCSPTEVLDRFGAAQDMALVATLGGSVVGVITTNVMPVLHRPMPVGRISALVVAQDHRRLGIGRVLVTAAEALLASRGCGVIEVTSNFRLERAHDFYESVGYEATSYRFKKDLGAGPDNSSGRSRFAVRLDPGVSDRTTMSSRPRKTYAGSCHCGSVRFEIDSDFPELTTCDCSICRRKNALMVRVHESEFRLLSDKQALGAYQFHTHTATHYFCGTCGIYPFHRKRVTPDHLGVNVFCLDDFDPSGIPVRATVGAVMP